jgi:hypothetical protein
MVVPGGLLQALVLGLVIMAIFWNLPSVRTHEVRMPGSPVAYI